MIGGRSRQLHPSAHVQQVYFYLPAPNREEVELELQGYADEVHELAPASCVHALRTWYHIDAIQEL